MANPTIAMNGTSFAPTSIEVTTDKIGITKRAANGKLYFYFRANKRKWAMEWNSLQESGVGAIRTIGALTTAFTLVDEAGTSHTVIVPPGGYSQELSAERISLANVAYYNVSLQLEEV